MYGWRGYKIPLLTENVQYIGMGSGEVWYSILGGVVWLNGGIGYKIPLLTRKVYSILDWVVWKERLYRNTNNIRKNTSRG